MEGKELEKNQRYAAKWFLKASIQGHKDAQFALGLMYLTGSGVEKNVLRAKQLLKASTPEMAEDLELVLENQSKRKLIGDKVDTKANLVAKRLAGLL